jgi:hypothetical protein
MAWSTFSRFLERYPIPDPVAHYGGGHPAANSVT